MTNFLNVRAALQLGLLVTMLAALAPCQVRIQARPGFEVDTRKVSVLYEVTCRVVAEEFHLREGDALHVPISLVLGESRDGVVGDETNQAFSVYMSRWDETMFTTSVSRIALQHLLSRDRKARIVRESLRRAGLIAPVAVDSIKHPSSSMQPAPRGGFRASPSNVPGDSVGETQ